MKIAPAPMKFPALSWLPGILLLLLPSCTPRTPDSSSSLWSREILASETGMQELAAKIGFNRVLLAYAADPFLFLPCHDSTIFSRPEFAGLAESSKENLHLRWQAAGAIISSPEGMGYSWGTWENLQKDSTMEYGNYLLLWKRAGEGFWKVELASGFPGAISGTTGSF